MEFLNTACRYLRVCRYLQIYYKMEPAGSRGVHALDDYQFVPFMWGSAQMISKCRFQIIVCIF